MAAIYRNLPDGQEDRRRAQEAAPRSVPDIFYFKEKPYVSLRKDWFIQEGNDRYEGFCIDILRALAEMYNFNYTIYNVPDNKYGLPDENGKWNGLVKELIDGVIEKIRVV